MYINYPLQMVRFGLTLVIGVKLYIYNFFEKSKDDIPKVILVIRQQNN